MTFQEIADSIKAKTLRRRPNVGWFDHCGDSYDMRLVNARAVRVLCRIRGERLTLREALWG